MLRRVCRWESPRTITFTFDCQQARIACHFLAGGGVAVQLEMPGQHAQRGIEFVPCLDRHRPVLGDQLGHPALRGGDADQPRAVRRVAHNADAVEPVDCRLVAGVADVVIEARMLGELGHALGQQRRIDAEHEAFGARAGLGAGGGRRTAAPAHLERRQRLGEFDHLRGRIGKGHRRMMYQRLRCGHRIECERRRVAPAFDAARHRGVARIQSGVLPDLGQADRFGAAPAARTEGALERLHVHDPAFRVDLQLPGQGCGRRLPGQGARTLLAERRDHRERVAPDLTLVAKESRGFRRALEVRRHDRDLEPDAGLDHQSGQPDAARREEPVEQMRHAVRGPAERRDTEPRAEQQAVGPIHASADALMDAVAFMQRERLGDERFVAKAHLRRMRPAAPFFVGGRIARARFRDAKLARRHPCGRRPLGQQRHRIDPGQAAGRGAAAHAHRRLPCLVGGGETRGRF